MNFTGLHQKWPRIVGSSYSGLHFLDTKMVLRLGASITSLPYWAFAVSRATIIAIGSSNDHDPGQPISNRMTSSSKWRCASGAAPLAFRRSRLYQDPKPPSMLAEKQPFEEWSPAPAMHPAASGAQSIRDRDQIVRIGALLAAPADSGGGRA